MPAKHPTKEECFELLKQYKTPDHVVRHCYKVTETAIKIAVALNEKGYNLDLELIQGAGLIHDIARVEDKHWDIGADIAADLGYHKVAEIIRIHMFYSSNPDADYIDETDIICLADRMVKEDEYVGLEIRMQYILEKFKDNKEAFERITEKLNDNKAMLSKIEDILGISIDLLF